VLVAVGRGQPGTFLGDQEPGVVGAAFDVKSHHVRQLVRDAVGLIVAEGGQGARLAERAQPRIEHVALFHGSDHRGIGAGKFHSKA
jgi:hypothetical protein